MVYCGYLDGEAGKDMVAIKTCKGKGLIYSVTTHTLIFPISALSLVSDKEKLLKEVTTMLSLKHPNVMSLIGVCFDGEMPMILMPFMSNGNVLGYVKQNKWELLLDRDEKEEKVYYTCSFSAVHS